MTQREPRDKWPPPEAETRPIARTPPRYARWVGWALCLALAAGVLAAAARVPW